MVLNILIYNLIVIGYCDNLTKYATWIFGPFLAGKQFFRGLVNIFPVCFVKQLYICIIDQAWSHDGILLAK